MSGDVAHALSVVLLLSYLLSVERGRVGVTSIALLGLLALYGLGFWYFIYAVPDLVGGIVSRMQYVIALGSLMFVFGLESVRMIVSGTALDSRRLIANWPTLPILEDGRHDHWLALTGIGIGCYLLFVMGMTGRFSGLSEYFAQASEAARTELRRTQVSGGYLYGFILMSIGPFLSSVILLRAVASRNQIMRIAAVVLCGAVMLGKFAAFTKSLWVIYVMQLALTLYVTRSLRLPLSKGILAVALTLSALFIGSWLAFPEASAQSILTYLLYRIVQITNEGVYQTLYVYPEIHPFSEGLNIGLLAAVAGYDVPTQAHTTVANFFGAYGATFNTMFMSGAWVDFGWIGVAAISFLVGMIVRIYDQVALAVGKTAVGCAMLGFALVPADQLMATSAQTALLSGGLLSIPLIVLLCRALLQSSDTPKALRARGS